MDLGLRVVEGVTGIALVMAILLDIFNGVIVPRPTVRGTWLSRGLTRPGWRAWRALGSRATDVNKRESVLGIFPPVALVGTLVAWVAAEVFGYGLVVHALRADFSDPPTFLSSLYVAAATLFSVGQNAHVPIGHGARLLVPVVTGTGLGTMALVITFLFSLYTHFQRRRRW